MIVLLLAPEAYWPLRRVGAEFHAAAEGTAAFEQAPRWFRDGPPALLNQTELPTVSRRAPALLNQGASAASVSNPRWFRDGHPALLNQRSPPPWFRDGPPALLNQRPRWSRNERSECLETSNQRPSPWTA